MPLHPRPLLGAGFVLLAQIWRMILREKCFHLNSGLVSCQIKPAMIASFLMILRCLLFDDSLCYNFLSFIQIETYC